MDEKSALVPANHEVPAGCPVHAWDWPRGRWRAPLLTGVGTEALPLIVCVAALLFLFAARTVAASQEVQ